MASNGPLGPGTRRLMTVDFSKAFLYGDVGREVYIELPDEDGRKCSGANVGLLRKSMYGLRDAPLIWQKVVRQMLFKRGFKHLIGTQCMYTNPVTGITLVAHVDDLLLWGTSASCSYF